MQIDELAANVVARLVREVLLDKVTPETVRLAGRLICEADFVLILAGANLKNLPAGRELALEGIERL